MNWFRNMKLAAKLVLGFVVVLVLAGVLGVFSILKLSAVRATTVDMGENWLPSVRTLGDMRYDADSIRRWEMRLLLETSEAGKQDTLRKIEDLRTTFHQHQALYDKLISGPEEKALYDAFMGEYTTYIQGEDKFLQLFREGKSGPAAEFLMINQLPQFGKVMTAIEADIKFNNDGADKANKLSTDIYSSARIWVISVLVGVVLVGLVIAWSIARLISQPVLEVRDVASQIAAGDLSNSEIEVKSADEVGELARAINSMQGNLRQVIQSISENAQNVANASEEFSSVSQQITANSEETSAQANAVSAATEEVNRNLQTVATATEEMSASISEIAKNATEAARVAGSAMETANETNAIVSKLGESSAEIGQVIKVITSIAQKTDLLALNATVEAARAGEVGAGFAVVANEVKELAKQTAAATEDISRKIEAIQTDAKSAVAAIGQISGIISQVNQISGTIAAAVEEQSATTSEMSRNLTDAAKGAGEVGQNIHGVAQAAQNTSQGATDSLKAAQQLAKMSTQLRGLVEQFKLEKNSPGAARFSGGSSRSYRRTEESASDREEVLTH